MNKKDEAVSKFMDGCACSQAIFSVYCRDFGMDENEAMRISAGFAAGMQTADTCGVVTGALMALGLKYCDNDCATRDGRVNLYEKIQEFTKEFARINGSHLCKEILECDVSTEDGRDVANQKELFKTKCPKVVGLGAEILENLETVNKTV